MVTRLVIKLQAERGEFGVGTVLALAFTLIVAAFVVLPGLKLLSAQIMNDLTLWWTNTVSPKVFPTT